MSGLVKQFLTALAAAGSETDNLAHDEKALRERIRNFSAAERLSRAKLHNRRR